VPTYEYKCISCDNRYETKEGFDAPSRQNCPRCGAVAKRVLFAPPIVFKGNGFYITDSRKGSSATIGADAIGAPSGSESKTESPASTTAASAESKPAAAGAATSDE
jgi:putative FmdB family regulatory protein